MSKDTNSIEQHVLEAIRSLKYGEVAVQVHDSRVVQVEKTEKVRFPADKN